TNERSRYDCCVEPRIETDVRKRDDAAGSGKTLLKGFLFCPNWPEILEMETPARYEAPRQVCVECSREQTICARPFKEVLKCLGSNSVIVGFAIEEPVDLIGEGIVGKPAVL